MTHITEPDMTPSIGYRLVPVAVAEKVLPLVEDLARQKWICAMATTGEETREEAWGEYEALNALYDALKGVTKVASD